MVWKGLLCVECRHGSLEVITRCSCPCHESLPPPIGYKPPKKEKIITTHNITVNNPSLSTRITPAYPNKPQEGRYSPFEKMGMHVVSKLFGYRVVEGCNPGPCVELYIEDDGLYYFQTSFDASWLMDLKLVTETLLHLLPPKEKNNVKSKDNKHSGR